ncbi:MAG: hypothetical protein C4519_14665 [Desulfobacteraceae bacterium]|nr:MAG: hypothetical protein C4519_14665 [Desulfobacteraceae bacterium]
MERAQKTGTLAILSIIAAIAAFISVFSGSPVLGLFLAFLSIPLGIFGLIMAASPRVSGGIMSIAGIVLGGFGLVIAILGAVGMIIF